MWIAKFAENPLSNRQDLRRLMEGLWAPLEGVFEERGSRALLGDQRAIFGARVEGMEGTARILWGLFPLWAGGGGASIPAGLLRRIILEGTGPGGWGPFSDFDQRIVETPAIVLALLIAHKQLWDPLDAREKKQVVDYFRQIEGVRIGENNWLWFRVLTRAALRILEGHERPADHREDMGKIHAMWHPEAGYSDGPASQRDGYVPMAMHFYGLILAKICETTDPELSALLRGRARHFASRHLPHFCDSGAAIPFGRSLQYRFAEGAFWAGLAFAGEEALPWGVIKGVLLRNLRHWMAQPLFTESGRLTVGYAYPQPHLAEGYGSSAGPYWALKSFLVLALPETHPFWRAEELPLPERREIQREPGAGRIVSRSPSGDDSVALSASASFLPWLRHHEAKYQKFAYSAEFGFSVSLGTTQLSFLAPDSMLALSDDGRHWRVRERSEEIRIEGDRLVCLWKPWPDVTVETVLSFLPEGGHRREHQIRTLRKLWSAEGGFCIPRGEDSEMKRESSPGWARGRNGRRDSSIRDEDGLREGKVIDTEPTTHLLWPLACLPLLEGELGPGEHQLRCLVRGRVSVEKRKEGDV